MFKLVTGSPGDGKTSNELWDFLHAEQYKNRPKYCTPINGFNAAEHGVTEVEHIKIWEELPEGAVFFCDEVQDFVGTDLGKEPPEWAKQFARHRHTGKDFICTTQSPMFLHPFVRKLAKPHVHYIRPWNLKMVRYTWDTVQNDPTTRSAKNTGQRHYVKPNPKVFDLYTSTVLDTHKAKPPYKVLGILGLALLVVIGGAIYVTYSVLHVGDAVVPPQLASNVQAVEAASETPDAFAVGEADRPVWTEASMKPRIAGLAYTAPVYDKLTEPTDFPRVSACVSSQARLTCSCYTQQGTPIDVPTSACLVFVKHGAFDPWFTGRHTQGEQGSGGTQVSQVGPGAGSQQMPGTRGAQFTVVADNSRTERKNAVAASDDSTARRVR